MFGEAVERALEATVRAHDGQWRKGRQPVPYVTHPMHVAIMLARWGLEEHVIVAGLMHDTVEDCGEWTIERVRAEFGSHVATIVDQLTEDKSLTWEERKRWAIDHVPHMSPEAASVKAADKIHNLQCLLADLRDHAADGGHEAVWVKFKGGRDRTLQMDRELVDALCKRTEPKLCSALRKALEAVIRESEHETRPELASGS